MSRLKIIAPLGAALVLTGLFLYLLFQQSRKLADDRPRPAPPQANAAKRAAPSGLKVSPELVPLGDPTNPDAKPSRPHHPESGEFFRWKLGDLPEGWDPAIARIIHDYFEQMEVDVFNPDDAEKVRNLGEARKAIQEYLASLGPEAVPTLAAILNMEADFVNRRMMLFALGDLGPRSEAATWALQDYFYARHENPANRSEVNYVVDAMGRLNNDSSFDVLQHMIERQDKPSMRPYRWKLIEALGNHSRNSEATGVFIDHMIDGRTFDVRNRAAQALGKVRAEETLSDLYHAFQKERIVYARQTILGTIGKIGDPDSIPFLEEQARGAKEDLIRISAAGALNRIGTPHAKSILKELARVEPNPGVRRNLERWAK